VSVQKHPISAAKKRRSPGTAVAGKKKKRSRKPTDLPAKKKTKPQTGRLPPQKQNGGKKTAVEAVVS
jgi:hypothetical protein